jgi:integrase
MGVRKRHKKWWVDFCFRQIRYRRPSPVNSKSGALAYELQLKQKLSRGEPLNPQRDEIPTFKRFVRDWFETYVKNNNKHSEILSKEMILRVHLVPYFGCMKIDEINNLDIEKYKAQKLTRGLSAKTVNNHLAVLQKAFQSALEWNAIKTRPIIKRLKTPPQKYDFLTAEECRRLLDTSKGTWRDMITVALGTGVRFGELVALTWEDVDFRDGELTIRQAYAKGVLGSTKSNRIRHIPMSRSVRETLYRIRKKDSLVFSNTAGGPLKLNNSLVKLKSICRDAGLREIGGMS